MERTNGQIGNCIWLLAWGVASSVWCLTAAAEIGATFDEPGDVGHALTFWRTGSHYELLRLGAMPLPMDVCALPIYIWERWQGAPIDLRQGDQSAALWLARLGALPFWWLLLYYGWRAGSHLGGRWGGRLTVALLAAEPNFLAHACLATKDIAISACLLALVYHFRVGRESGWWRRVGVPGFWFGMALLSKASALVFGPLALFAVEVERLIRQPPTPPSDPNPGRGWRHWWRLLTPWRRDVCQLGLLGLGLMFIYCGSDWCPQRSFVSWAHQLPDGVPARVMVWLAEHLRIFSNAGEALVRQVAHNLRGHGAYLLGRADLRSIWYYFPVALSIKLTLTFLVLPLVVAVVRPRALTNWACAAAAVLLLYSLRCNVQIGIRLMLPVVALAAVGLGAALARAWQECAAPWQGRLLRAAAVAGVAWPTLASIQVWPHALCYTNELWGGTARGYLCLSDSNYDWGQGLKDLAAWQRRHRLQTLDVWYFGTDPILETLPMRPVRLYQPAGPPESMLASVRGHYLAVSTTLLYGPYTLREPAVSLVALLKTRQPVDRTQTFLIYDFTEPAVDNATSGRPVGRPPTGWPTAHSRQ
jgi:hypothetical protein